MGSMHQSVNFLRLVKVQLEVLSIQSSDWLVAAAGRLDSGRSAFYNSCQPSPSHHKAAPATPATRVYPAKADIAPLSCCCVLSSSSSSSSGDSVCGHHRHRVAGISSRDGYIAAHCNDRWRGRLERWRLAPSRSDFTSGQSSTTIASPLATAASASACTVVRCTAAACAGGFRSLPTPGWPPGWALASPHRRQHTHAHQTQQGVDAAELERRPAGTGQGGTQQQQSPIQQHHHHHHHHLHKGGGGCDSTASGASRSEASHGGARQAGGEQEGGGSGDVGGGRPLPLRAALRLLYKRVHPDLFHDQPLAKDENERSFKLLQEYVQLARGGDPRSPAARLPYRFAFYLRAAPTPPPPGPGYADESDSRAEAAAPTMPPVRPPVGGRPPPSLQAPTAAAAGLFTGSGGGGGSSSAASPAEIPGLHLVRVTLPPPAISAPDARELGPATRKALVKLLAACGVATSGRELGAEGPAAAGKSEDEADGGPLSLAAFLPEAVEALWQAEAARSSDPAVRVANLRGAMRLRHQVMVSFSDKQLAAATQVALLERLARVVDAAGPQLRLAGCHVVVGNRLGLDRLGQLCLSWSESDDAWAAFLTGVDVDFALQQRKTVQALRGLEERVAHAVGVAQVFTPYGNLMEPSYRSFLERLAAAAALRGPLGGGAFRDVSLCGLPPLPTDPGQSQPAPPCRLDDSNPGVVQVATDAEANQVYAGVARLGGQAQAALRVRRHVEAQLQQLADRARQRLRLRSLTRDPRVAPDHFRRACGLLLDQAEALTPLLEGATVRIGFANRLAPDGSCIEIAHNCEL